MARCTAIIVAAGRGHRFGGQIPKQYRDLGGRAILRHSLGVFLAHPQISEIRVVIHPDDRPLYEAAAAGLDIPPPIMGGPTRQDSVRLGLEAIAADAPELVLIHDGARPFVDGASISRCIAALASADGAIPALPLADTVKRVADGHIANTIDRSQLWRAQTPQAFRFGAILAAHRQAQGQELTDDSAVAEMAGLTVTIVPGNEANAKITSAADLTRAARLAELSREIATGQGFDVHRFCPGDHVTLCGIEIPYSARLEGHSDADVAWHALTDAILGAVGAGDIGLHFPPSQQKWRGAASSVFLAHAGRILDGLGARLLHADLTLICEAPKIGPHRMAMIDSTADCLGVDPGRISVKATTTEGLGFTGRREGIAAQAIVTIDRPPRP